MSITIDLVATGDWAASFRPTQAKVSLEGPGSGDVVVEVFDGPDRLTDDLIGTTSVYLEASGDVLVALNFTGTGDLVYLRVTAPGGWSVVGVAFFVWTPTRGLTDEELEALSSRQLTVVHLFRFDWNSGAEFLADGRVDMPWNGATYLATGDILEVPQIKETLAPAMDAISISLSGVNQANIYRVLSEDYTGVSVSIYRAIVDDNMQFLVGPLEIYAGIINAPDVNENPVDGTSKVTWKATSHWVSFDRKAGRRCNDADQQKWYPGDRGLEYASKSIAKLVWGSA